MQNIDWGPGHEFYKHVHLFPSAVVDGDHNSRLSMAASFWLTQSDSCILLRFLRVVHLEPVYRRGSLQLLLVHV